jgi:hypothetical protein
MEDEKLLEEYKKLIKKANKGICFDCSISIKDSYINSNGEKVIVDFELLELSIIKC